MDLRVVLAPGATLVGLRVLTLEVQKRRGDFALTAAFELPTPGVVALFGRSGCGKSTLVNLIAGLLSADAGRIELDGTTLLDRSRHIDLPPERRRLGYVFQNPRLFPHLRVDENLRYGSKRSTGAPYVNFDTAVALLDLAPHLRRSVHGLSGGERQRVAIGRALLSQPRLLLLDEPLAALDRSRRDEVLPYLETLRDQLAIPMVYVTHDFEEVLRLATHVVVMHAGAVVAKGSVSEMSREPHLRAIIGSDAMGSIIEGRVLGPASTSSLSRVSIGRGEVIVQTGGQPAGALLRVQLLARDVVVSTQPPQHLSVRNHLAGIIAAIETDDVDSDLITIDAGVPVLARITKIATRELGLTLGMTVWALVKSVSLRGHAFRAATRPAFPDA